MPALMQLIPGTRFRLAEMEQVTGVLLKTNECRALVRLDRPAQEVEFLDREGEPRSFTRRGSHVVSWSPATVVEAIGFEEPGGRCHGKRSKATKKTGEEDRTEGDHGGGPKRERVAQGRRQAERPRRGGQGAGRDREPMNAKEMIEAMAAKGYWTSPGGKTPHATLYSRHPAGDRHQGEGGPVHRRPNAASSPSRGRPRRSPRGRRPRGRKARRRPKSRRNRPRTEVRDPRPSRNSSKSDRNRNPTDTRAARRGGPLCFPPQEQPTEEPTHETVRSRSRRPLRRQGLRPPAGGAGHGDQGDPAGLLVQTAGGGP